MDKKVCSKCGAIYNGATIEVSVGPNFTTTSWAMKACRYRPEVPGCINPCAGIDKDIPVDSLFTKLLEFSKVNIDPLLQSKDFVL